MQSLQHRHHKLIKREDLEYLIKSGETLSEIARYYDIPLTTLRCTVKRWKIVYISKLHNVKCFRENKFAGFRNKLSETAILNMFPIDCFK